MALPRLSVVGDVSVAQEAEAVAQASFVAATSQIARLLGRHAARVTFKDDDASAAKNIITAIVAGATLAYLVESILW